MLNMGSFRRARSEEGARCHAAAQAQRRCGVARRGAARRGVAWRGAARAAPTNAGRAEAAEALALLAGAAFTPAGRGAREAGATGRRLALLRARAHARPSPAGAAAWALPAATCGLPVEQLEPDPKTWKTGGANTYQMLPERDRAD